MGRARSDVVGMTVVAGQARVTTPSATTTTIIQTTPRLVLDWQSSSVPRGT